jgi:putative membrane protein
VATGEKTENPARVREHLANERTFLAWVRTGMAVVIFGFAIGRFAIGIQEFTRAEGHPQRAAGISVWFGLLAIATGITLVFAGLNRYRRNRVQLEAGTSKLPDDGAQTRPTALQEGPLLRSHSS